MAKRIPAVASLPIRIRRGPVQSRDESRQLPRDERRQRHQQDRQVDPVARLRERREHRPRPEELRALRRDVAAAVGLASEAKPAAKERDRFDREQQVREAKAELEREVDEVRLAVERASQDVAPVQIPHQAGHPGEERAPEQGVLSAQRKERRHADVVARLGAGAAHEQGILDQRVVDRLPEVRPERSAPGEVSAAREKGQRRGDDEGEDGSGTVAALAGAPTDRHAEEQRRSAGEDAERSRVLLGDEGEPREEARHGRPRRGPAARVEDDHSEGDQTWPIVA